MNGAVNDTPTQPAARSAVPGYGSPMASTDPTDAALTACATLQAAEAAVAQARSDRDKAIVRMSRSGMSEPAISRALREAGFDLSASGVRYIVRGTR